MPAASNHINDLSGHPSTLGSVAGPSAWPQQSTPTYGLPYWGYHHSHQVQAPATWAQNVSQSNYEGPTSGVFVPFQDATGQATDYETSRRTTLEALNRELGHVQPGHNANTNYTVIPGATPMQSSATRQLQATMQSPQTQSPPATPTTQETRVSRRRNQKWTPKDPTAPPTAGKTAPNAIRSTRTDLATEAEMAEFYTWTKTPEGLIGYAAMKAPYFSGGEKLLCRTLVHLGFWGVHLQHNYNKHRPPGTPPRDYRKLHELWDRVKDFPTLAELTRIQQSEIVDLTTTPTNGSVPSAARTPDQEDLASLVAPLVTQSNVNSDTHEMRKRKSVSPEQQVLPPANSREEYLTLAEALRSDMPLAYGKSIASDLATNLQENMTGLLKVSTAKDLGKALEGNMRHMYGELPQLKAFLAARFPQTSAAKRSKAAHGKQPGVTPPPKIVRKKTQAQSKPTASQTVTATTAIPFASSPLPASSSRQNPLAPCASQTQAGATTSLNSSLNTNQTIGTSGAAPAPTKLIQDAQYAEPVLCREQADLVELIVSGRNVFYTGSAGCGKSTVLKAFTHRLREMGKDVRIVAPTGRAALDINGSTTWTFAGWTPNHMKKSIAELEKNAHGKFVNRRLRATDVLVIDEISMVENHYFERLNRILKTARGKPDKPFGGLQLIVTGDFCQLPPVKPFQFCIECGREMFRQMADTVFKCPQHGEFKQEDKWAFRSKAWEECQFAHVNLTQIHRQSDKVFIDILQKLRIGTALTFNDKDILLNHPSDTQNAVQLFCTHAEVKRVNDSEFNRLQTRKVTYTCLDTFNWNPEHRNLEFKNQRDPINGSLTALREHRLDPIVELKEGMLVVLLVNLSLDEGLVNGSQGRIVGFEKQRNDDMPVSSASLRSKPSSKNKKGEPIPPPPTAPVLGGEYAGLREAQIKIFITTANKTAEWPIVRFDNGITRTIFADCRVHELGDDEPYSLLMRTQIPLVAAWAMTIHKSQGMTLNRVIVDLAKSFEEGQEYVALSRARSLEGLEIKSLGRSLGAGGNEQVREFLYRKFGVR